ncbi:cercosporin toxin biosynthesis protein [Xylaria longipes]|nr:cercosporin toxin biosynthesis protein [Xylaria longipes]
MSQIVADGMNDLSISKTSFRVIIIGAGLGGLTLAQSLRRSGIPFTIFERDSAKHSRPQGYRIKIHGESAAALRSVLTPELWQHFVETCGETVLGESTLNAVNGSVLSSRKGHADKDVYTVDRSMLRHVLQQGLSGDGDAKIVWGKEFTEYKLRENGTVEAYFKDGAKEVANLLVGADGSRSRTTKLLVPNYSVLDTQGLCIYGKTFITPQLQAVLPAPMLRWLTISQDHSPVIQSIIHGDVPTSLVVEPMRFHEKHRQERPEIPNDYLYWTLIINKRFASPEDVRESSKSAHAAQQFSLDITSEWHPSIRALFQSQDETYTAVVPIFSARPHIVEWEPDSRVTILGDAVHLMSPTGGVGACSAIQDACVLGSKLAKDGLSTQSIGSYEREMRKYAARSLQRSLAGGKKLFGQQPFDQCPEVFI